MSSVLLPSYPAPDYAELARVLSALQGVSPAFQIDIVDGVFAAPASWPVATAEVERELLRLKEWQSVYQLEFDLMVHNPVDYFALLSPVSPARVVVHLDRLADVESVLSAAFEYQWKVDIAILNSAPREVVWQLLAAYPALGVQIMGIETVGKQGQPFDTRTLANVRTLRARYPEVEITIDGAVNTETIPLLYAAGASRFAPGSAITQASTPVLAYKQLLSYLV